MRTKCYRGPLLFLAAVPTVLFLLAPPRADGQILYRETFGATEEGADLVSTDFQWQTFEASGALRTGFNVNRSANLGFPADLVNTASAGDIVGGGAGPEGRGWAYLQTGQPLAITQEFSFAPVPGLTVFSWQQLNPNATRTTRLLVEVGGDWYASAQGFSGGSGGIGTWATNSERKSLIYDPAAANWLAIAFDGGFGTASSAAIPGGDPGLPAVADLVGNITGFGIWHDQNLPSPGTGGTGNSRYDNFTIRNIPEPSGIALGLLAAAGLGIARRRRS